MHHIVVWQVVVNLSLPIPTCNNSVTCNLITFILYTFNLQTVRFGVFVLLYSVTWQIEIIG